MTVSRASRRALSSAVVEVTDVEFTGNIIITFSEAVDPLTVTNVGDGSGSMEFSDSGGFIAGVLSTSDNIQYTFNPTANLTIGDIVTATLTSDIESAVGAVPYAGPFAFLYKPVDTTAPTMSTFVCDATSTTSVIPISALSATDADSVAGYLITESPTKPTSTTGGDTAANWIANGYDTSLGEGTSETVTLYAWAYDPSGNISDSLNDSCDVTIADITAPTMTSFSCDPTTDDSNIGILTLSATDTVGVDSYQVNESATPPDPGVGIWQSSSLWIGDGYTYSGGSATVTLYAWAKDAAGNVSSALSDECVATIPIPSTAEFTAQPAVVMELSDGAYVSMTVAEDTSSNVDIQYYNGSSWAAATNEDGSALTNVVVGSYNALVTSESGAVSGRYFRVSKTGLSAYTQSNEVTFTTQTVLAEWRFTSDLTDSGPSSYDLTAVGGAAVSGGGLNLSGTKYAKNEAPPANVLAASSGSVKVWFRILDITKYAILFASGNKDGTPQDELYFWYEGGRDDADPKDKAVSIAFVSGGSVTTSLYSDTDAVVDTNRHIATFTLPAVSGNYSISVDGVSLGINMVAGFINDHNWFSDATNADAVAVGAFPRNPYFQFASDGNIEVFCVQVI